MTKEQLFYLEVLEKRHGLMECETQEQAIRAVEWLNAHLPKNFIFGLKAHLVREKEVSVYEFSNFTSV